MKTLFIVRHAKSSWDYPQLQDFERPIIKNGINKTEKLLAFLKNENVQFDLIVSSHATRAIETAQLIAKGLNYPSEHIMIHNDIYEADEDVLLDIVHSFSDDFSNIMIVGHNPTFTQFANNFLKKKIDYLPTSGAVSLSFKTIKWTNILNSERILNFVAFPKKITL